MKFFLLWGGVFVLLLSTTACSDDFDDSELQKKIADLTERILELEKQAKTTNTDLATLQSLVQTLQGNLFIAKVEQTSNGYIIHFTNGDSAEITNGEKGDDAPVIGIKADTDEIYYWTITSGGKTEWLTDSKGEKLRADAVKPKLGIDKDGYWTISYDEGKTSERILDADGNPVAAMRGIFSAIEQKDGNLVVTLNDGSTIIIPIRSDFYLLIKDAPAVAGFEFGETKTFTTESAGVERVVLNKPDEWKVAYDNNTLTITAPTQEHAACADLSGEVTIIYFSKSFLSTSVSLKVMIGEAPVEATDLSLNGTANCYIVSSPGTYAFDATVIGNGAAGIITGAGFHTENPAIAPESVKLMWQDYFADGRGLIQSVSLNDAKTQVLFTVPDPLVAGNAVIAVSDAAGKIIWSWHIWLSPVDFTQAENVHHYQCELYAPGFDVMDRNLGATSVTPKDWHATGLHYQWGRKDPFITTNQIDYMTEYKLEGPFCASVQTYDIEGNPIVPISIKNGGTEFVPDTWAAVKSGTTAGTIANTIAYPMNFLTSSKSLWLVPDPEQGGALWGNPNTSAEWPNADHGKKSIYDPCPVGWRVAPHEAFRIFSYTPVTMIPWYKSGSVYGYEFYYDSAGHTAWYPTNAYRLANTGCISVSRSGGSWTSSFYTATNYMPSYFSFYHPEPDDSESPKEAVYNASTKGAMGEGVRCVKEL